MGDFSVPNAVQKALCRECGIDPEGMIVVLENDNVLAMVHLKTRNEVTIGKGDLQRRKEKNGNQ